jgi:cytoskeletal protein CcmA (bactofilin family)
MPANPQDKVLLTCPQCAHQQQEPRTAFSTVCRKCGLHLRVQEVLRPVAKTTETGPERKRITCFDCGAELEVPVSAESTMCKKCSRYVDLKDYKITSAVSKNFKTKGTFVIEPKGYVFNTETTAHDAVLKGRFLGKLVTHGSLTIYSTAEIKGSFVTPRLIIPAGNAFRWTDPLQLGGGDISGELAANLTVTGTLTVRASGRLFGDVTATHLCVEEGAVVVGRMTIGGKPPPAKPGGPAA